MHERCAWLWCTFQSGDIVSDIEMAPWFGRGVGWGGKPAAEGAGAADTETSAEILTDVGDIIGHVTDASWS